MSKHPLPQFTPEQIRIGRQRSSVTSQAADYLNQNVINAAFAADPTLQELEQRLAGLVESPEKLREREAADLQIRAKRKEIELVSDWAALLRKELQELMAKRGQINRPKHGPRDLFRIMRQIFVTKQKILERLLAEKKRELLERRGIAPGQQPKEPCSEKEDTTSNAQPPGNPPEQWPHS